MIERQRLLLIAALAAFVLAFAGLAPSSPAVAGGERVRLLVKFQPSASADARAATIAQVGGADDGDIPDIGVKVISVPEAMVEHALGHLRGDGNVAFAEQDVTLQPQEQLPDDPYFLNSGSWNLAGGAWGWYETHTTQAWDITEGAPSTVVAILDTGIKPAGFADLDGQISSTWNVLTNTTDATTNAGNHGTYVAGVVGLALGNGSGGAGVCPHCKLMIVQVGSDSGASLSALAAGLIYAADHGARVANMSWAGSTDSATLQSAIAYAHGKGLVMTAAAGNSNCNCVTYPAADQYVLGVAGTNSSDGKSSDSNYGNWVKLAAPEGNVTAWPTIGGNPGFASFGGTSSAAPFAAGVAGLLFSYNPALTNTQVEQALESSAAPVSFGVQYGRVDALSALESLGATDPQPASGPLQAAPPRISYEVNGLANVVPLTAAPQVGQILVRGIGGWTGSAGLTVSNLQWLRCNSAGTGCSYVTNAGTYTVSSADAGATIKLAFSVSNPLGSVAASALTAVVGGVGTAPANSALPTISGVATDTGTLAASTGTWAGAPTSYSYAWAGCDASGAGCTPVAGASGPTYQLHSSDIGHTIRVTVTAFSPTGSSSATSAATGAVSAVAPVDTTTPAISGQPAVGQMLAVSDGSWSGSTPMTKSYQWSRCASAGTGCAAIAGATSPTYTVASADGGSTVVATVTASNQAGSASAVTPGATVPQPSGTTSSPTVTFNGSLSARGTSQSFALTVGSGPLSINLAFSKAASSVTLTLQSATGTVAQSTGSGSTFTLSATPPAGSYTIVVSGSAKGNDSFTLTAT